MNPLNLIPDKFLGIAAIIAVLAIVAAIFGAGHHMGARGVQAEWDADILKRERAEMIAVAHRLTENKALEATQAENNRLITRTKDDEITKTRAAIVAAPRMRIGPALCSGPAASTEAKSTSGSDGADAGARLVRPDVDRDIRALELKIEEGFSTGRACQAFVVANGLAP
jgi:prophage endopeptidase